MTTTTTRRPKSVTLTDTNGHQLVIDRYGRGLVTISTRRSQSEDLGPLADLDPEAIIAALREVAS